MIAEKKGLYPNMLPYCITVIGCGGIGSIFLRQAVALNPTRLVLWDDDVYADKNLDLQDFPADAIDKAKVDVQADEALRRNPELAVTTYRSRFAQQDILDGLVVCCVDSMESRKAVFEASVRQNDRVSLFFDGRLSRGNPEYCELYTIDPKEEDQVAFYRRWVFDDSTAPKEKRPDGISALFAPIQLSAFIGMNLSQWMAGRRYAWKVALDGKVGDISRFPQDYDSTHGG